MIPIDELLKRLEVLEAKATPGPWCWNACGEKQNDAWLGTASDENGIPSQERQVEFSPWNESRQDYDHDKYVIDETIAYRENDARYPDFDFIVALRNAAPRLFARIREQAQRIAELEARARERQIQINALESMRQEFNWEPNP